MQAAEQEEFDLMSLLLTKGADINAKDANGFNALRKVILCRRLKSIRWLIEHRIDVNARDNWGKTVLTYAKQEKVPQIISVLEHAGARE
jgi:ankyrin repeat protein